jgi:predicted regulator of Ras-like GTPase activity (Roadblock/LC7/MglB family)
MPAEDNQTFEEPLGRLVEKAEAMTALLISKEGNNLAEAGDTTYLNTTAVAALIAGMFTATREVARMVGERQFSILLQQGENRHIHISLVTAQVMMVVVFEDYQRIGRVRHEARRVGAEVTELLLNRRDEEVAKEDISVPEFKEYALNLIDRIFVEK